MEMSRNSPVSTLELWLITSLVTKLRALSATSVEKGNDKAVHWHLFQCYIGDDSEVICLTAPNFCNEHILCANVLSQWLKLSCILVISCWIVQYFALVAGIQRFQVTMFGYLNGSFGPSNNRITGQIRGDWARAYGQPVSWEFKN